jgi:hypothetical protein
MLFVSTGKALPKLPPEFLDGDGVHMFKRTLTGEKGKNFSDDRRNGFDESDLKIPIVCTERFLKFRLLRKFVALVFPSKISKLSYPS